MSKLIWRVSHFSKYLLFGLWREILQHLYLGFDVGCYGRPGLDWIGLFGENADGMLADVSLDFVHILGEMSAFGGSGGGAKVELMLRTRFPEFGETS